MPQSQLFHLQTPNIPVVTQRQVPTVHTLHVLLEVVDMPVVVLRQVRGSTIQKTVVVPQLQFLDGRRLLRRAAEAHPHGPVCSKDHRDSASLLASWPRCRRQFCGIMRVSCHEEQFLVSSPS